MPGVFAVGDCANPMKAVTLAISMGTGTAGGIVMQVQGKKQE
jgi:gliotoxin/aspirochlorine biosynthesis thioredoxin reductase